MPNNNKINLDAILPVKDITSNSTIQINCLDKVISINVRHADLEHIPIKLWYLTDITQQQKTEEELFIFRNYMESTNNQGIIIVDREGKIIFCNNHSTKYEELPQNETLGRSLKDLYDQTLYNPQEGSEIMVSFKTGKPITDKIMHYRTISGKNISAVCSLYPIKKEDHIIAVVCALRYSNDIRNLLTETINLQKQLLSTKKRGNFNGSRFTFEDIVGNSDAIKSAIEKAKKASFSSFLVLIYGETGTGKELFAQSIHNASVFKDQPFVAINCAAIPESLLESTLFGTVKGAFTGAENLPGLFEQAADGTIFLDEINSMPINLQTKLLRVLQENSVRRIGAKNEIPIRCRVISSSNEDPWECVKKNTIRNDLFYRLSAICINAPPLRERNCDIIPLANYFLQEYAPIYGNTKIKMSATFQETLLKYSWPGNIRELKHIVESAIVMVEDKEDLSIYHLPPHLNPDFYKNASSVRLEGDLKDTLLNFEKEVILNTLKKHNWNISRSAKAINVRRSNLQYRMRKLEIENPRFNS